MEVVNTYIRGYDAYHEAKDEREEENFEEALDRYEDAAGQFRIAEEAAEKENVKQYCYEARVLTEIHEAKTREKLEQLERQERGNSNGDDEEFEPTNDDVAVTSDRCVLVSEYQLQEPADVTTQTRLPPRLGDLAE